MYLLLNSSDKGMDHQLEVNDSLLDSIDASISLFNDLFSAVAPIASIDTAFVSDNALSEGPSSSSSKSCVPPEVVAARAKKCLNIALLSSSEASNLSSSDPKLNDCMSDMSNHGRPSAAIFTGRQCIQIQHISGHLSNMKRSVRRLLILHNRKNRGNRKDFEMLTENAFLQSKLNESKAANSLLSKQLSAVKNYLVNEINRAEKSEEKLHEIENVLVDMTVERDEYKKKFMDQNIAWNSGTYHSENSQNRSNLNRNNDGISAYEMQNQQLQDSRRNLVGVYIRKEFNREFYFGLVVLFEFPFYKVTSIHF